MVKDEYDEYDEYDGGWGGVPGAQLCTIHGGSQVHIQDLGLPARERFKQRNVKL